MFRLDDLSKTERNRKAVEKTLATLDSRYSDGRVKIDTTTKDPARIMAVPGCVKCKGSHWPERPWRRSTLDGKGSNL